MRRDQLSPPSAAPLLEILEPRLLLAAAISINDVALAEGNSGTTPAVFTVTLSQAIVADATVNWATADGTATVAGNDYVAASGILTIPAGQTTGTITVVVKGDTVPESDKTIFLNIDYAEGADIVDGQGRCVILDDDGVFLPFGGKTKAQFNDANHEQVTVQLTGPGSGQVHLSAPDGVDALGVVLNGTTALSWLTITTTGLGSKTTVGGIVVNGSLNALTAKTTDLLGGIAVTGSLKTLQLDDVAGGGTISVGGPAKPTDAVTIQCDQVSDLTIDSRTPISALTVTEWRDANTPADAIRAPWLGRLTTTGRKVDLKKGILALAGDFGADLVLSGVGVANTGKTLGAVGIKGSVAPSVWDVTGKIGAVTVGGTVGATGQPWELKNATALASLTLGDVTSANVTVGGVLGAVKAMRWTDGLIEADSLTSLSITGRRATATLAEVPADFSADVLLHGRNVGRGLTAGAVSIAHNLSGSTWNVGGNAGPVLAGSAGPDWVANFTGALGGLTLKGDATVRLAAKSIKAVSIGGNLTDSLILAGADLGTDADLGGSGSAADIFGAGFIGSFKVAGQVSGSLIGAGLDPADGHFNDSNDVALGGRASKIGSVTIGGTLSNDSRIDAGMLPAKASINKLPVNPVLDSRFGLNAFVQTQTGVLDSTGSVTFTLGGSPQAFTFLDANTGGPLSGAWVGLSVDPSLGLGMMSIVTAAKPAKLHFLCLMGTGTGVGEGPVMASSAAPLGDASPTITEEFATSGVTEVVTSKLVDWLPPILMPSGQPAQQKLLGELASVMVSLATVGLQMSDTVSHGWVSQKLGGLPGAETTYQSVEEATAEITAHTAGAIAGKVAVFTAAAAMDPLAIPGLASSLGVGVLLDLSENFVARDALSFGNLPPNTRVRKTTYRVWTAYTPEVEVIPMWEQVQSRARVPVTVEGQPVRSTLYMVKWDELGVGVRKSSDSNGVVDVPVPPGPWQASVVVPGMKTKQFPMTVPPEGVIQPINFTASDALPVTRIPGTISYFGMFSENYEIWGNDAHGNPVKTASGTSGFRLTIWMKKLGTGLGTSVYEIKRVMCSDPYFGAQMAVPTVYPSVAVLGDPPKNLSDSGEGFAIFFPNGATLGTVNGAGAMHMSSDGRTISNSLDPSIQPITWLADNPALEYWEAATIPGFDDGFSCAGIRTHSSWSFSLSAL